MLKWRCPSQVFHAHWGPFQGAVNFCWSKKKNQDIVWCYCGRHSVMFKLLESTILEGIPRANFLPNCPYYFSVFMGIPYAFCVWYMVSSLRSIYFFVIQLLVRMIFLKEKRNLHHSPHFWCPHDERLSI